MLKYFEKQSEVLPRGLLLEKMNSPVVKLCEYPPRVLIYEILLQHQETLNVEIKDKMSREFHGNVKIQLERYLLLQNPETNSVTVEYIKPTTGWGRYFPRGCNGLSMLKKEIRNCLIKLLYYDFDLKNSCQMIVYLTIVMYDAIEELNIVELKNYCLNRESYLEEIIVTFKIESSKKRDIAKDLMIRLSNMGELKYWLKENNKEIKNPKGTTELKNRLKVYSEEILRIASFLKDINKDGTIYEDVTKLKKTGESKLRSFFSSYVYEIEARIMNVLIKYLMKTPLLNDNDGIFEADGIKLRREKVDAYNSEYGQGLTGVINLLESKTKELTNYSLTWMNKPMDLYYEVVDTEESKLKVEKDIIIFKNKKEKVEIEKKLIVSGAVEARNLVWNKIKNNIKIAYRTFFYKINNIWTNDTDTIKSHLRIYIQSLEIYRKTDKDEYYQTIAGIDTIITNIYSLSTDESYTSTESSYQNEEIYKLFHETTVGRVCFLDGVLCVRTKQFYKWNEINFDYFTTVQIKRKYESYFNNPNRTIIEEIKSKILKPLVNGEITRFSQMLSRTLFGYYVDKNWCMFYGNRNCGKGLFYTLISRAFGSYISPFELTHILTTHHASEDLEEKSRKLYWLLSLEFVRLAVSQETPKQVVTSHNEINRNLILNGKMLKSICSGGDLLHAKRNYDRFDTTFSVDAMLMIMGNNPVEVSVPDANEHCISFKSSTQFKSQEEYDNEECKDFGDDYMSGFSVEDPGIKSRINNDEYANALVYLIYESFIENKLTANPINIMMDNHIKPLREQILDKLTITKNKTDIINSVDLYQLFGNILPAIISKDILSFPDITYREIKTGPQAGTSVFIGVKIKETDENIDDLINEINNKIIITNDSNDMILVSDINEMFKDYTPKTITNYFKDLEINKKKIYNRGNNYKKWIYIGIKLKE